MPSSETQVGKQQLNAVLLGGIDQRSDFLADNNQTNFNDLEGVFPDTHSTQARVPGKTLLQYLGQPIISLSQIGTRIYVQTSTSLQLFTLNELYGIPETEPIPTPDPPSNILTGDEDTMSYALLKDIQATNVAAQTFPAIPAWTIRRLTDKTDDTTGAVVSSLVANVFTLPIGKYRITAQFPAISSNNMLVNRIRLYNQTDSAVITPIGINAKTTSNNAGIAHLEVRIDINTPKAFRIEHYTSNASALGGSPGNIVGDQEIYGVVKILKEA